MTAKAIEASSAMLVTSIAVAIISTTTPDHVGVRAPKERSRRSFADGLDDLTRLPHRCPLGVDTLRTEARSTVPPVPRTQSADNGASEVRRRVMASTVAETDFFAAWLTANVHVASTSPLAARPLRKPEKSE
jgi:hypothetical protein